MQNNESSRFKTGKGDLTQGNLTRHLIRLSLPMTWGIGVIISFQLVDMYFISQLPGTHDLAAISFTFPITFAIFSITIGFSIAMSSVISRLIGAGDDETVRQVVTHGLMMVLGVSSLLNLSIYLLQNTIFSAMGAEGEMLESIRSYMNLWFLGAICVSVPMTGNAAIRAGGDAVTPATVMTMAALMNVILDPIMIFGHFGFPRMELEGAALATVISNIFAMLLGFYILAFRKKLICTVTALHLEKFWSSVKRLLFITIPVSIANVIQPIVSALIVSLLATHGHEAVAAFGIVNRIESFAFIILMGLAVGMAPIIGQNFGAGKFDRIRETLKKAIGFSMVWSFFVAIALGILGKQIAGLFEQDPKIIEYAGLFFWIVPITYIFSNLIRGWASAFNAMGKPHRSFMMVIVELVVLMIPAIYLGNHFGGVKGIFIAVASVNVLAGTIFHLWSWRTCRQLEKSTTQPVHST